MGLFRLAGFSIWCWRGQSRYRTPQYNLMLHFPWFWCTLASSGTFDLSLQDLIQGSLDTGLVEGSENKTIVHWAHRTAGHSVRPRRKDQDWKTARRIWLVFQKKKDKVFIEIWRRNWGLCIPHGLTSFDKCFSNSGPKSLSITQLLKYHVFVTSHSDLSAYLPNFCSYHFTIQSTNVTRSSTEELNKQFLEVGKNRMGLPW